VSVKRERQVNKKVSAADTAIVVLALLLSNVGGCGLLEKPTARITHVALQDIGVSAATLVFDIDVANPYTVALPLSNVDYALSSRASRFLSGSADLQGTIPAGSSKTLTIPVGIDYRRLLSAVEGTRPGGTVPYTADLGLSVDTPVLGRLRIPMSREGELPIPSASELLEAIGDRVLRP